MLCGASVNTDMSAFLRRLRSIAPGCSAAAIVDLEAGMVLTEDSQPQVQQELWDALATKALDMLTGEAARACAVSLTKQEGEYFRHALLRRGQDVFLLLRSKVEPPLGLMFICDPEDDTSALIDAATQELEILAATT